MKFLCTITLVFLSAYSIGQEYSESKIDITKVIPDDLVSPRPYIFFKDLERGDLIELDKTWIEKNQSPGEHCHIKPVRRVTKKDFKGNAKLQMNRQMQGANLFHKIDDKTAIYGDSVYTFEKRQTLFRHWLGVEFKSYAGQDLFSKAITADRCGKLSLDWRYRSIDLHDYSKSPVKVIYKLSSGYLDLLVGDSLIIGGNISGENLNIPIGVNPKVFNKMESYKLDSALIGKKVVTNNFNFLNYRRKDYPSYFIRNIEFRQGANYTFSPILNLESAANSEESLNLNLKNSSVAIYDADTFGGIWTKHRNDYLNYLSESFTDREVEMILERKVFIGMSENALYESIGRPQETNSTVIQELTQKQCVYGDGIFVYIRNAKVSGFQNIESLRGL